MNKPDERFFETRASLNIDEALEISGANLSRDAATPSSVQLRSVSLIVSGDMQESIIFADNSSAFDEIGVQKVGLCLTSPKLVERFVGDGALAVCDNPRWAFAKLANVLHRLRHIADEANAHHSSIVTPGDCEIHPTAIVDPRCNIGNRVRIDAFSVVGPGVCIGDGAIIGAHVLISCADIGEQSELKPGAKIGQSGFGMIETPSGLVRMPQLGRVQIGHSVEIGANTTIDRGALGDTIIGDNTKIDNQVQIGHNVVLGRSCVIASQTGISGSTIVGDGVAIGGQVGVGDHLTIGSGVRLAARSGVMHNIPDGETWGGAPAKPVRTWMREVTTLSKLATKKNKS